VKNVVADALSRLPTEELFTLNTEDEVPLNLSLIAEQQLEDETLLSALASNKQPSYKKIVRENVELYAHAQQETIYVPTSLRASLLQWYHLTLQHPGVKRMQATIREHFYWPGIDAAVESLVRTCDTCQKCKLTAVKRYGKIPLPAPSTLAPWEEVHMDLVGPWDVQYNSTTVPGRSTIEKIHALTALDKATGWPEFTAILNKTSYHVAILFDSTWLCHYPRPVRVVYDNGTKFVGQEFQELLQSYGIKPVPTTVRNPRSNGVVERVHLTMGDMLQMMTFRGADWFQDMQRSLDAVAWAVHTTINPNIKYSPCHLAFNQDMIFCQAIKVDWEAISNEPQRLVTVSNQRENRGRINKQYSPGDQILIVMDADERRGHPKMKAPTKGPYPVTRVYTNGTIQIKRGNVSETIHIRRLKPYYT